MKSIICIFLSLSFLWGCSSSNAKKQYSLEMKEFPADYSSLIESVSIDGLGNAEFSSEITEIGTNMVKVNIRFDTKGATVQQDDWQVQVKPSFKPTFNWAPHLTPTDKHIIDQHVFRSPALIVTDRQRGLVIIPDLDILSKSGKNRWYMDMDAETTFLH